MSENLNMSDSDYDFYSKHGWWISNNVIPNFVIDSAAKAVADIHAGYRAMEIPIKQKAHLDWKPDRQPSMRMHNYAHLLSRGIDQICRYPAIAEAAAFLSRSPSLRIFNTTIVDKPANLTDSITAVGWHTDRAYWRTCSSTSMLTAWIPLVDMCIEMGPLTVIDGSHNWNDEGVIHELRRKKGFVTDGTDSLLTQIQMLGFKTLPVPIVLKRGQFSLHHCLLLHASSPNYSNTDRLSLTVHIQDHSNTWSQSYDSDGLISYQHDSWCLDAEGNPNYHDKVVCPILWKSMTLGIMKS
jgi:ectoine hydroxylase-related dioxygenase (phytanoyl-CoA dioxygenase family)